MHARTRVPLTLPFTRVRARAYTSMAATTSRVDVDVPLPHVTEDGAVSVDITRDDAGETRDPDGWFASLGLPWDAPYDVIRKTCRKVLRETHPDKVGVAEKKEDATRRHAATQRMMKILLDPGLRATYHAKGGAQALSGIRVPDGTEGLHLEQQLRVTLRQLSEGDTVIMTVRQRREGELRPREVSVSWPAGTPAGHMLAFERKGHSARVRDPVFMTEETRAGDLRVTLVAIPEQTQTHTLHAFRHHLKLVVLGRTPTQNLVGCPLTFMHPDGERSVQIVPAANRGFSAVVRVPHAGLSEDGDLWVLTRGAIDDGATIMPRGAVQAICDANGWAVPPEVDDAVDLRNAARWTAHVPGTGSLNVQRIGEAVTMAALKEAETAAIADGAAHASAIRGRTALTIASVARGEDAALAGAIVAKTGASVGESDTVSQCQTQ